MFNIKNLMLAISFFLSASTMAIEFLTPVENQHWLASTSGNGLVMLGHQLKPVASYPGRYEQTASLKLKPGYSLVAAVNENANSLDVFTWDGQTLQLLDRQKEPLLAVAGVCLYQEPATKDIHAFLIKEHDAIEQRIVFQTAKQKVVNQSVRTIPVPEAISSCAANSQTEVLYLAEEGVGVWRLSANPETDASRKPVAVQKPYGDLDSSVASLALLDDDTLLIPQPDSGYLMAISQDNKKQSLLLTGLTEAVAVSRINELEISVLSGESLSNLSHSKVQLKQKKAASPAQFAQVPATDETDPVAKYGDAADDPAIWFNPANPSASLVLGTDKKRGLAVYNLQGTELQFLEVGRINNVDLRPGFEYQNQTFTLATASQRDNNAISLFFIDGAGLVSYQGEVATNLDEVYGLCMYQPKDDDRHYVFINDKDGRYQQYRINNDLTGDLVREFKLSGQPEGCVANDENGDLFVGIEDKGIWFTSANASTKQDPKAIVKIGGNLQDDVEGMALYQMPENDYLVVSSQGNNSFALYDATSPFEYLGSFQVAANLEAGVDGASETDGLDVSSANFGGHYEKGLLVVQDGRNVMPQETQNFKLIAFGEIAELLSLNIDH